MCVNDLVVQGAEPLFFLDYFATGELDVAAARTVIAGIAAGCAEAGCALVGGETAEMPGMYGGGDYDLAGLRGRRGGARERCCRAAWRRATWCWGWRATGCTPTAFPWCAGSWRRAAWAGTCRRLSRRTRRRGRRWAQALMTPTRIYVRSVLALHRAGLLKAAAHITGGGLPGNLPRVLPDG